MLSLEGLTTRLNRVLKSLDTEYNTGLERFTKTGTYTADSNDDVLMADVSGGGFTITLPSVAAKAGHVIRVKLVVAGGNTLTVARAGSDTIDGATSVTTTTLWGNWTFISDGDTEWLIF